MDIWNDMGVLVNIGYQSLNSCLYSKAHLQLSPHGDTVSLFPPSNYKHKFCLSWSRTFLDNTLLKTGMIFCMETYFAVLTYLDYPRNISNLKDCSIT